MKTYWKIIFIAIDVVAIGLGVPLLVGGLMANLYHVNMGDVEIGSCAITMGLLVHYWRKHYFNFAKPDTDK